MTLILTVMRPGEGIWQTVDGRLTRGGVREADFADKQLDVHCWDGTLLIAYAGRAELRAHGESTFDWLRSTLRGESRTVDQTLFHLRDRLNRDYAGSRDWNAELTLVIAGVLGERSTLSEPLQNQRMARWYLTNVARPQGITGPGVVQRSFLLNGELVVDSCGWAEGSGAYVRPSMRQRERIQRVMTAPLGKPLDRLGLLAGINRDVSRSSMRQDVSPWCYGTYMPESGQELQGMSYGKRGELLGPPRGIAAVLFGFDMTDETRHGQMRLANMKRGLPPPPEPDPNIAVTPRS